MTRSVYGLWFMVLWVMVLRFMDYGLWIGFMVLWSVDCGLWIVCVVCGLYDIMTLVIKVEYLDGFGRGWRRGGGLKR